MDELNKLKSLLKFGEDKEYYSDNEFLTNSMLSLLNKSPQHLQRFFDGHKIKSKSLDIGKAFHIMVLEPSKLDDNVVVFEGKTRRGKAWDEFSIENADKTIISTSEWNMLNEMSNIIFENGEAMNFINSSKREIVEVWENNSIKCKGKVDMVINHNPNSGKKILVDLKTTKDSSIESFRRSSWSYGYDRQAAFYMDGFEADEFWFIVIEKESPYRMGIYKASDEFIESGREKYYNLIQMYREYFIDKKLDINKFYFKGEL